MLRLHVGRIGICFGCNAFGTATRAASVSVILGSMARSSGIFYLSRRPQQIGMVLMRTIDTTDDCCGSGDACCAPPPLMLQPKAAACSSDGDACCADALDSSIATYRRALWMVFTINALMF